MAGYVNPAPATPLLLQGTAQINFKAAVPGTVGAAKDTLLSGVLILANAGPAQVTLAGYLDNTGAAASIVLVGSTTVPVFFDWPRELLNQGGAFSATPSVAATVWLFLAPYLGGPV